ncbi:MAG: glycosyltransferase family 4 protein [Actinobacteria bacterium]|nr:glycosyltransferase family 4 protein [Nocardioidaceae bacterium]MBA3630175.1 glycosyltransferase family 4 protein [Actinomycetota bacterium]
MRVLQLHNHHASLGGAMEVLAYEGALLRGDGHSVRSYTLPAAESLGLSSLRAGAKAIWNRDACQAVAREIIDFSPDVVHVHTPFPLLSPAVFRTAVRLGVPAVTTVHSFRYSCIAATCYRDNHVCEDCIGTRLKLPGLLHKCYHDSYAASGALTTSLVLHKRLGTFDKSISRFIALTDFAKQLLIRDGIPSTHIAVKPNSVPDPGPEYVAQTPSQYVAFVGRLVNVKGVRVLLDAWRRAPAGFTLKIAGDGPMRTLVEERSALDPTIEYLGWLEEEAVTHLIASATCVVVPSEWYEGGVPLVVLRSLAVGTPVIVSDLDNICADVLRDDAGAAFVTGDADSLSHLLTSLMVEEERWTDRRSIARKAYEERYTPESNVASLTEIYRQVVAEGTR